MTYCRMLSNVRRGALQP